MADEDAREPKQLRDFTDLVERELPRLVEPVRKQGGGGLGEAIDQLLALEKKTRLAADGPSTRRVALAIVELLFDLREWAMLNEHISLLCKRRAQLTMVMQAVIQRASEWLDRMPNKETQREYIDTLRAVSAGKIYVELERARMTRKLAELLEEDGDIAKATEVLQDVQVETIGSMEVREKAEFLLEQLRLILTRKDYVRSELIAKKVSTKVLEQEDMQDVKLKFYNLMIEFHHHSRDHLAICKSYKAIYDTPNVQADPAQWKPALKNTVMYLVLSPFDSEVSDLLHRVNQEKKLLELPSCKMVLDLFTTDELMAWPLSCDAEWRQDPVFQGDEGKRRYEDLRIRATQHNIRTVASYYHRIATPRLAQLLSISEDETEERISQLVSSQQLFARIDRPARIVTFSRKLLPNAVVNNWSHSISKLLALVDNTCHLISKENMIHKVK